MSFVDVIVNSPGLRGHGAFTYSVSPHLHLRPGDLVSVPFGPRQVRGVVSGIDRPPPLVEAREVLDIVEPAVLWPWQIALVQWIAGYYACSLGDAIRLVLPPNLRRRGISALRLVDKRVEETQLSPDELALVSLLRRSRLPTKVATAQAALGRCAFASALRTLIQHGMVERVDHWQPSPQARRVFLVSLRSHDNVELLLSGLKRSPRQRQVMEVLLSKRTRAVDGQWESVGVPAEDIIKATGCQMATIRALYEKGIIDLEEREVKRPGLVDDQDLCGEPLTLTPHQLDVWRTIVAELDKPGPKVFLLHGVTGSGKTEVYRRALEETLRRGRQCIVLVPEIALTPQTIHRFSTGLAGRVAVIHSGLSAADLANEWQRVKRAEADVVIGSRSAVFAPLPRPGLIVVDEEHEWTYKQDQAPRYHTRDVVTQLASLVGAKVILGSATPDVISYYYAETGRYSLLKLPERVPSVLVDGRAPTPSPAYGDCPVNGAALSTAGSARTEQPDLGLPQVDVVDMRAELRSGNRGIFSRSLTEGIDQALAARQQIILFINRRGAATLILCRDCGHVLKCRRCEVALVYHGAQNSPSGTGAVICHSCNRRSQPPQKCPDCGSRRIRYFGVGTERVEAEVRHLYPSARVIRWDRDVARKPGDHQRIMEAFAKHELDVLVGTQMVAKGLDFPLVTLVGVIAADTSIHLPDLRAGERTFQLLTQVAGRAGRAGLRGRVVVQTYCPEHYCVQAASHHDYEGFYRREIEFRRLHGYPPWRSLTKLVYTHSSESHCRSETERLAAVLRREIELLGFESLEVVGPVPAYYRRVRGKSRWQILIWGSEAQSLLSRVSLPLGWMLDVDPVSLL